MRRFLWYAVLLASACTLAHADTMQHINIWGTFVSNQPCIADCTLTVGISFDFFTHIDSSYGELLGFGHVIPSSLAISSSGAGMLPYLCCGEGPQFSEYLTFFNAAGDELDIRGTVYNPTYYIHPILNGIGTLGLFMWYCKSEACSDHFGPGFVEAATVHSTVTSVAMPEPGILELMAIVLAAGVAVVRRKRPIF